MYVPSDTVPVYQILKQSVMEILHFKDLGATESVVTNTVVLVLGEWQISMAMYLRGYLPSYKIALHCIGKLQCYATLKSSRTDTQTDRHTNSINTIVSQPLRGSTICTCT